MVLSPDRVSRDSDLLSTSVHIFQDWELLAWLQGNLERLRGSVRLSFALGYTPMMDQVIQIVVKIKESGVADPSKSVQSGSHALNISSRQRKRGLCMREGERRKTDPLVEKVIPSGRKRKKRHSRGDGKKQ